MDEDWFPEVAKAAHEEHPIRAAIVAIYDARLLVEVGPGSIQHSTSRFL